MLLRRARIQTYKCFIASSEVDIDPDITCVVGKNESGKTAFLEALYRLNPVLTGPEATFYQMRDFPRKERSTGSLTVGHFRPLEATFDLEEKEIAELEDIFGPGVLPSNSIELSRDYDNNLNIEFEVNERAFIRHITTRKMLQVPLSDKIETVNELRNTLNRLQNQTTATRQLLDSLVGFDLNEQMTTRLKNRLPKFIYFNEFSTLPSRFSITHILNTPIQELSRNEITAHALLDLAEITSAEFSQADHEARKVMLEGASRFVTNEVFKYWSQNNDLRLDFDIVFQQSPKDIGPPPYIDVRIWNDNQRTSLKFGERSKGFIWFFSFLVFFFNLQQQEQNFVLLLDEPGLGLHASAQRDLLRFMEDHLAKNFQVIYTSHSPFMIAPDHLNRVRMVEDNKKHGSFITNQVERTSMETMMPVQAAMGQKLYETLSLGPSTLLVERPSDILYLNVLSTYLRNQGRKSLDEQWEIIPIGKVDNIPSFSAMLSKENKPAILSNVREDEKTTILNFAQQQYLEPGKLFLVTDFTGSKEADLEDMFSEDFFLDLVRSSGIAVMDAEQLPQGNRILERIQMSGSGTFDPLKPALQLLKEQETLLPKIDVNTLNRFEELFNKINQVAMVNGNP